MQDSESVSCSRCLTPRGFDGMGLGFRGFDGMGKVLPFRGVRLLHTEDEEGKKGLE